MDSYYRSDKFKRILHEYEEYVKSGIVSFLNSEELTDVAEYYHLKGDVEKAYQAANYALDIFPVPHLLLPFVKTCTFGRE